MKKNAENKIGVSGGPARQTHGVNGATTRRKAQNVPLSPIPNLGLSGFPLENSYFSSVQTLVCFLLIPRSPRNIPLIC